MLNVTALNVQSCKMKTLAVILWKSLPYSSIPSPPPVQISAPATSSLIGCSIRFFITTVRIGQWVQALQHACFFPDQGPHAQIPQISLPTPYWQNLTRFTSPPDPRKPHLKTAQEVPVPREGRQWEAATHLLQAAGAAARGTAERPLQRYHLAAQVVYNPDGEGPCWPTAIPGKAVSVLCCKVHPLPQCILELVFVVFFKASHNWKIGKKPAKFLGVFGQTLPANSAAALWEGKPRSKSVRGSCWQGEMIGKDPQAVKPDGEVQREESTMKKDMWKEHGDSHQSPVSPLATDTCCLSKHQHYQ